MKAVTHGSGGRRLFLRALACAAAPAWAGGTDGAGFEVRRLRRAQVTAWTAADLHSQPWNQDTLRGRAVLLNFWASWCAPCREEMPTLHALQTQVGARRLQVLLVNYREPLARVRSFVEQQQWQLPVLTDPAGAWARQWGVSIFPSSVLIDAQGRAYAVVVGAVDWIAQADTPWMREWLS